MAQTERRHRSVDVDLTLTLFEGDRAALLDGVEEMPRRLGGSSLLWIDTRSLTDQTADEVLAALGLADEVAETLSERGDGRYRDGGSHVHVVLQAPDGDGGEAFGEIECVVGKNWVMTSHERPVAVLDTFAELAEGSGPTGELDGPSFLAALFEWVLNEYAIAFDALEEELEALDERAMRGDGSPESHIEALVELRGRAGRLRRALSTHRSLLLALTRPELEALGDEASAQRFQALLDRYETTIQTARDARESVVSSFDVLIARTGHRTNEIMKVLTLASVSLLPGALLAGVMGMNFKVSLFDYTAGFWIVIGILVAIGVVPFVVARHRRWI